MRVAVVMYLLCPSSCRLIASVFMKETFRKRLEELGLVGVAANLQRRAAGLMVSAV